METLYATADLDRNGRIGWSEVETFQRVLVRNYRYRTNDRALRPDQFIEQRGGDCEDFALMTAGLLRFWNWQPYIGSFIPASEGPGQKERQSGGPGHAICLAYSETVPIGYTYYGVTVWTAGFGDPVKEGKYIPIDYDHTGMISNAMDRTWQLRAVYIPESIYGTVM